MSFCEKKFSPSECYFVILWLSEVVGTLCCCNQKNLNFLYSRVVGRKSISPSENFTIFWKWRKTRKVTFLDRNLCRDGTRKFIPATFPTFQSEDQIVNWRRESSFVSSQIWITYSINKNNTTLVHGNVSVTKLCFLLFYPRYFHDFNLSWITQLEASVPYPPVWYGCYESTCWNVVIPEDSAE